MDTAKETIGGRVDFRGLEKQKGESTTKGGEVSR